MGTQKLRELLLLTLASPVGALIREHILLRHSLLLCHHPLHRTGRIPHPYTHPEPRQSGGHQMRQRMQQREGFL